MNLDEALAVWLYMQHQYKPSEEAKRKADLAWKVICSHANEAIHREPVSNGDRDERG
jgi:hypothetical protein